MTLVYRNRGERRYGLRPIAPYPRRIWEIQFILRGRCSLFLQQERGAEEIPLRGPLVCLSGPGCSHGWGGRPRDVCQALVFHFDAIDPGLQRIVGRSGCRLIFFSPAEIPRLLQLYDRCQTARQAAEKGSADSRRQAMMLEPLVHGIVSQELALFLLRHLPPQDLRPPPHFENQKVAEALSWYESNLSRNPRIQDVARAIHLSSSHLRRIFHHIRGESPQAVFSAMQFARVKWLLQNPALSLEQIAENCGFGSSSAFSRAFKNEFGLAPRAFRQKILKPAEKGIPRRQPERL